jgi:hypothetical protein
MDVTVHIPDDLASRLSATGSDLSRRALEALALEEFKSGHLTKPELRQLLGYETRAALDGFLKAHAVFEEYSLEDLDREREGLERLGLRKTQTAEQHMVPASIAHLQKTDPQEWGRQFDAWVNSHDPNTPVLSDDAMSRESIYPDRI